MLIYSKLDCVFKIISKFLTLISLTMSYDGDGEPFYVKIFEYLHIYRASNVPWIFNEKKPSKVLWKNWNKIIKFCENELISNTNDNIILKRLFKNNLKVKFY